MRGAHQPPGYVRHAIPYYGGDSALYASRSSIPPCPFRKKTTRKKTINTQGVHGTSGSTEILQTRFLGTLFPCRAGLTLYQTMSISRIALLDLNQGRRPLRMPIVTVRYTLRITAETHLTRSTPPLFLRSGGRMSEFGATCLQ